MERERQRKNQQEPSRYHNIPARASKNYQWNPGGADAYDESIEEEEYVEKSRPGKQRQRKRSIWPILFSGCALGVVCTCTVVAAALVVFLAIRSTQGGNLGGGLPFPGNTQTFTSATTQQIPITTLTQIQVCDKIGNITLSVDPQITQTTVIAKKIVHADSPTAANQQFKNIGVEIQPPQTIHNPLTCAKTTTASTMKRAGFTLNSGSGLTINTTIPDSDSMLANMNTAVDLTITVPPTALPQNGPTMQVTIVAPLGNIRLDGISGLLNVRGSTGNVTLQHTLLAEGSHIETGQGNVTFDGRLIIPNTQTSQDASRFTFLSESGNIDVTIPRDTNITLDANTNVGTIKSDFDIQVEKSGNAADYHGPLTTTTTPSPTTLVLDVSTGNVIIHKSSA